MKHENLNVVNHWIPNAGRKRVFLLEDSAEIELLFRLGLFLIQAFYYSWVSVYVHTLIKALFAFLFCALY